MVAASAGQGLCSPLGNSYFLGEVGGVDRAALGLPCANLAAEVCYFYLPTDGVCTLNFRGFITCPAKRRQIFLEAAKCGPGSFLNSALRLGISQLA